jgi:hypothetical protein
VKSSFCLTMSEVFPMLNNEVDWRRMARKKKKNRIGINLKTTSLFLLFFLSIFAVVSVPTKWISHGQDNNIFFSPEPGKASLQLYWFTFPNGNSVTPSIGEPLSTSSCGPSDDNGIAVPPDCECIDVSIVCKSGKPYDDKGSPLTGEIGSPPVDVSTLCGSSWAPTDGRFCVAKPVIYLYPEVPTLVNVTVKTVGKIVVSDPLYPQGGWKNILAYPNGNLLYQGKQYPELFYESSVNSLKKPEKGIIIKTSELRLKLDQILDQLGLIDQEKDEFLAFWLPKLQSLKSPYIFFSLLDKKEKDAVDNVRIIPTPDTEIAFIAYFKPVDTLDYDNSLQLPSKPQRKGFVSVEWGGSLDTK